jgi:hypothetical protein
LRHADDRRDVGVAILVLSGASTFITAIDVRFTAQREDVSACWRIDRCRYGVIFWRSRASSCRAYRAVPARAGAGGRISRCSA